MPASYYFEWSRARTAHEMDPLTKPDGTKKTGVKYAIQPAGATVTWLAGLYRIENGYPFFTILTRSPVGELGKIHDRMPLILPENAITDWINPASPAETVKEISAAALTDMVMEPVI